MTATNARTMGPLAKRSLPLNQNQKPVNEVAIAHKLRELLADVKVPFSEVPTLIQVHAVLDHLEAGTIRIILNQDTPHQ